MLDILDLKIFAAVVRAGSLSAAGRELNISVPVVSKRLAKLEEQLGARLVQRTTRQLTLTDVGEGFVERVLSALDALDDAQLFASVGAQPAGLLRVSAPTGFGQRHIAPHINAFLTRYPEVQLRLDLSDEFVDLISEGYDIAVRIGSLEDSSFIARRLAPNRRFLCASPEYIAEYGEPQTLDALSDHQLLMTTAQAEWPLEGPDGAFTYVPKQSLQTNSSEVVRAWVLNGMGIALRSTWDVGEELKEGKLKRVLKTYRGHERVGIYALYPSRRQIAPKVRVFIDFLTGLIGPQPEWDEGF